MRPETHKIINTCGWCKHCHEVNIGQDLFFCLHGEKFDNAQDYVHEQLEDLLDKEYDEWVEVRTTDCCDTCDEFVLKWKRK